MGDKSVKKLIARSKRRKRGLIIHAKTTNVLWILCKLLWRLNLEQRLKLFVLRRSLSLTSMSLKLLLTMPTRPMLRLTNPSRGTKPNFVMLRVFTKKKDVNVVRSLRKLVWLIAVLMLFKESLRKLVLFLILLTVARSKLTWNWLKQEVPLMT